MSNNIPEFIKRDPAEIMAECKATLEEYLGREIEPSQVEQLILNSIVYREILLVNRFNAGMAQMLYQFSSAPVLDYIAALVGVERLSESKAGCTIRFNLVEEHGGILIPKGTRVASADSKIVFETTAELIVPKGISYMDVYAAAQQTGTAYNGYAKGEINVLLDPYAFISSAENLATTGGGSDMETDEQLRERIKLAPSQFSSAGSRQSYLFHAKSANTAIKDVSVTLEVPGTVVIVPLLEDDADFCEIRKDIKAACNDEKVRPLTDTVKVKPAQPNNYSIHVKIVLEKTVEATPIKEKIQDELEKYARKKRETLGQDIIKSHISQICRLEDVYDVKIISPVKNVAVATHEYANCEGIEITIKELESE